MNEAWNGEYNMLWDIRGTIFILFVYFELNVNETALMDIYDDAALGVIIVIFIVSANYT